MGKPTTPNITPEQTMYPVGNSSGPSYAHEAAYLRSMYFKVQKDFLRYAQTPHTNNDNLYVNRRMRGEVLGLPELGLGKLLKDQYGPGSSSRTNGIGSVPSAHSFGYSSGILAPSSTYGRSLQAPLGGYISSKPYTPIQYKPLEYRL